MTQITTYTVRPSPIAMGISAALALAPVIALTAISSHLGRRGWWLALPWSMLLIFVIGGEATIHSFAVALAGSYPGEPALQGLLGYVEAGSAFAVFVTTIALAVAGRRKL